MRPHSQQAYELKLALEAGVVESSEIINWADQTLSQCDYDDDLANVSMAGGASSKDLIRLLSNLIDQCDEIKAMRSKR